MSNSDEEIYEFHKQATDIVAARVAAGLERADSPKALAQKVKEQAKAFADEKYGNTGR